MDGALIFCMRTKPVYQTTAKKQRENFRSQVA